MKFTTSTKPEQMRLTIVLIDNERADLQALCAVMYKLAHKAGYKKDIPATLVPFIDEMYAKFDYGLPTQTVTNHIQTLVELDDEQFNTHSKARK